MFTPLKIEYHLNIREKQYRWLQFVAIKIYNCKYDSISSHSWKILFNLICYEH